MHGFDCLNQMLCCIHGFDCIKCCAVCMVLTVKLLCCVQTGLTVYDKTKGHYMYFKLYIACSTEKYVLVPNMKWLRT